MGALFLRTGALTLGTTHITFALPKGDPSKPENATLKVEFRCKKNLKPEPNAVDIKIWNLSAATRKLIEQPKTIPVQLDVGYGGENHTIYLGELRSAQSEIDGPDVVTTISSGDKEQSFSVNRSLFQVPRAATPKQIIELAAKGLGAGTGNLATAALSAVASTGGPARTYHGLASKVFGQVARSNGLEYSIQDGALQVMPIGQTIRPASTAVLLSADTGMLGSPTVDNKGIVKVKALIMPGLFPGMPVIVKGALLEGTYRIESTEYAGDTWGADWTILIHGKKWS